MYGTPWQEAYEYNFEIFRKLVRRGVPEAVAVNVTVCLELFY